MQRARSCRAAVAYCRTLGLVFISFSTVSQSQTTDKLEKNMKKRVTQTLLEMLLLKPAPAAGTSNILARFLALQIEEVLDES